MVDEGKRLSRDFFIRDGITVARELLGKVLVHESSLGVIRGIITETESYMGVVDKGSHTYGGRRTERTEPMFAVGGTSYVYFTYGMYHCMNIATEQAENPQAVLIRSVVPADEESKERMLQLRLQAAMKKYRSAEKKREEDCIAEQCEVNHQETERVQKEIARKEAQCRKRILKNLADGPGKMCIAMEISKAQNNVDMVESKSFYVTEGLEIKDEEIREGKRIGIDYAKEAADYLWRFYLE